MTNLSFLSFGDGITLQSHHHLPSYHQMISISASLTSGTGSLNKSASLSFRRHWYPQRGHGTQLFTIPVLGCYSTEIIANNSIGQKLMGMSLAGNPWQQLHGTMQRLDLLLQPIYRVIMLTPLGQEQQEKDVLDLFSYWPIGFFLTGLER